MKRIVYMGTGEIGVPAFRALAECGHYELVGAVTQPDRPIGRHQELHASAIKIEAEAKKIKILQPEKVNQENALAEIRALKPDLIIVCAYGQILKKELLEIPSYGCINIHASLLPRHRGAACIPAPILSGDQETGITIMRVGEGLDTGDILLQEVEPIRKDDTSKTLHDRLAKLAAPTLLKALELLSANKLQATKQDDSLATYAKKLKKEDGVISWNKTAEEIERHIRAMFPWPTAYTWLEDDQKLLKIFSAEVVKGIQGKAGEIVRIEEDKIYVATGQEGVVLKSLQLEGKRKMSVKDFLKGHHLKQGQLLISK